MRKVFVLTTLCAAVLSAAASDTTHVKKYSAEQLKSDLAFMVQAIEEVHPNAYHSISREAFTKKYDSIQNSITGDLTAMAAWPKFATLIGAINEGHTSISWPAGLMSDATLFFPFYTKDFDGEGFVVSFDGSEEGGLQAGDRILSINGVSASAIYAQFRLYAGGLPAWKAVTVATRLPFYLALHGYQGPFTIRYSRSGTVHTTTAAAQPWSRFSERVGKFRKAANAKPYTYTVLDGGIGYLNFTSMVSPTRFTQFVDSVFTTIRQQPVKGLVIDLRQNSGGNSALGDKLLEYLTTKKYRMSAGAVWKISQRYKDYYNTLQGDSRYLKNTALEGEYLQGGNGTFIRQPAPEKKPAAQASRFTGPVCFLIGSYTFSSANMLANAVKDYNLATLIGQPTGECPNDFGELLTLRLPHTGIDFYTSTKQYIRANGDEANPDPISPDIAVKDDPATAVDEVMEAAKQWIERKRD